MFTGGSSGKGLSTYQEKMSNNAVPSHVMKYDSQPSVEMPLLYKPLNDTNPGLRGESEALRLPGTLYLLHFTRISLWFG